MQPNTNGWVGQLYQMVKVNVNGVVKNLMIPVAKSNASAATGDASAKPGDKEAAGTADPVGRSEVATPKPVVRPNSSNTKLVIVNQPIMSSKSRSLLNCNAAKTPDTPEVASSPSSSGTCSVSSSPVLPVSPPKLTQQPPATLQGSTLNTLAIQHVVVGKNSRAELPVVVGGSSVQTTHIIQPVDGVNKHLIMSGVEPVAIQSVATTARTRIIQPVNLAVSAVVTSTTTVSPAVDPRMRTVHVMSAPTAPSPCRAPLVVGVAQPGTKQLVFTSTMPALRPVQVANATRVVQPTHNTGNSVIVQALVRPAWTASPATLAMQSVPATQVPRQVFVRSPQLQKTGPILQPVVVGNNPRTVVLTVPATEPAVSKASIVPRIVQPPKPRHVVVNGLQSIVPPDTGAALNTNPVRPLFTMVPPPSGVATAAPAMTYITSVVPGTMRVATSVSNVATGSVVSAVTQPKSPADTTSIIAYGSSHLKIGDVFSLQKGDSRIPSPLVGGALEPERNGSGMPVRNAKPLTESPLPPPKSRDPFVVLASWNKEEYCSSDDDDGSANKNAPSRRRVKKTSHRRITRIRRRTYGKFFQDAVARLNGCRVSLRGLELSGRTTVSVSEFEAERETLTRQLPKALRRAAPRCFLDAADPRRGDRYTVDTDGRVTAILVSECVLLFHKKARQKHNRPTASSPQKLHKTRQKDSSSPSLAKNEAPRWVKQKAAAPTAIAPKVEIAGQGAGADKKLRYLMVKTNAGTFLVPITSDGGLVSATRTNTVSQPPSVSRPVIERRVTRQYHRNVTGSVTSGTTTNNEVKVVTPLSPIAGRRTQYVTVPSQLSSKYTSDATRSLLSPRIKSEPIKSGYEERPDATETSAAPKRFKMEVGGSGDAHVAALPPPAAASSSGLSNQIRINQLKMELKKQQEAVEALRRRRRSDTHNVTLSGGYPNAQ